MTRVLSGFAFCLIVAVAGCSQQVEPPLRVGVVHALSGTLATSEAPLIEAARMAADELNEKGGVLGRKVQLIVADHQSDPLRAAQEADRLIAREKVDVLLGCWTSTCRKAVKSVVETYQHLLFYPVQYEGLEQSPNIVYTGSTANQQIIPGTYWALQNLGKRVFLLGSDYVFPRVANRIVRDVVAASEGTVVGEMYRSLGAEDFDEVVAAIRAAKPDVVLNTVNGDSNVALFRALQAAGLNHLPVLSFSVDAAGLKVLSPYAHTAHYAAWSYFQALPGAANQRFVQDWHARNKNVPVTDAIEASYAGLKLWAQAVEAAGSANLSVVNLAVTRQSVAAPSGVFAVDAATRHVWKPFHVGKARVLNAAQQTQSTVEADFDVVFSLNAPLRPMPFPGYRSPDDWTALAKTAELQSRGGRK